MGPQPLWQYGAGWMEQNSQLLFNTFTKAVWKIYANAKIPMQYIFWIEISSFKKKPCQPLQMLEQDSLFFCFFFLGCQKNAPGEAPPVLSIICTVGLFLHPAAKQRLATPHQVLSPGATGLATQKQNLECSFLSPGFASNASCIPSFVGN